jgi:hypothetical protein
MAPVLLRRNARAPGNSGVTRWVLERNLAESLHTAQKRATAEEEAVAETDQAEQADQADQADQAEMAAAGRRGDVTRPR